MGSHIVFCAFIVFSAGVQVAFGKSSAVVPVPRAATYDCYSCVGDKDSDCAKHPENVKGGTSFENGVISVENSTATCGGEEAYCISLEVEGTIGGKSSDVTYRGCLLSCKVIKESITTYIPPAVANITIKSCKDCQETKCNSSVVMQAVVILIITMTLFVKVF